MRKTEERKIPYHLEPGHISDFLLRILFIAYKDIRVFITQGTGMLNGLQPHPQRFLVSVTRY